MVKNISHSSQRMTDMLTLVENEQTKPQSTLKPIILSGIDQDGASLKSFNLCEEFENKYLVIFFFPLGLQTDSEEVLSFSGYLEEFLPLDCNVVGVTSESPLAIRRWIRKDFSSGGIGKVVGFPILSDKDLSLSMSLGVGRSSGMPARSVFIVDPNNRVRYFVINRADSRKSVPEILRLVKAVKTSDETGRAIPADWQPGDDLIPTPYSQKVKYYKIKYGPMYGRNCSEEDSDSSNYEESDEQYLTPIKPDPKEEDPKDRFAVSEETEEKYKNPLWCC